MDHSGVEMWTKDARGRWQRWTDAGRCLDAVASSHPEVVLVVVAGQPAENETALATIRLARRLVNGSATVIAGSLHPSGDWYAAVREAGADRALLLSGNDDRHRAPPLDDAVEIGPRVCPALHARHARGVTLSVCGCHRDKLVLARHHVDGWCLATKDDCPHWCERRAG